MTFSDCYRCKKYRTVSEYKDKLYCRECICIEKYTDEEEETVSYNNRYPDLIFPDFNS